MSCLRSRFLTRRTTASSARSIIRVETYHSGIFSFLCGVFGWQKLSGIAAPPESTHPDHRPDSAVVQRRPPFATREGPPAELLAIALVRLPDCAVANDDSTPAAAGPHLDSSLWER